MAPWFAWLENSWLGTSVNNSTWAFAAIEAGHLLALAILGAAVFLVNLRLLGFGLREEKVQDLARTARPWLFWGLVAVTVTGVPLMASLALDKYYVNPAFWWKMYFLLAAILFTLLVQQPLAMGDERRSASALGKVVAIVTFILWAGVGIMGRGIGFY
jgi:hypothetical protein